MQRFVNNWTATLQAPLLAADGEMQLPPALAAKLLMDDGDFYDLTIDPNGPAQEIVRVTAVGAGGATLGGRALEGTATPATWPTGTAVRCCATAAFLEALRAGGGGGGGIEDAPEDGEIYGRMDGGWELVPYFNDEGVLYGPGAWYDRALGSDISGTARISVLERARSEGQPVSDYKMLLLEVDVTIAAQSAAPLDINLFFNADGFVGRITPTPITVYNSAGDWEIGLLHPDADTPSRILLSIKSLDLTSGGSARLACVMPYPTRADE